MGYAESASNGGTGLSLVGDGSLDARHDAVLSVGMLCDRISTRFPASDAEPWDRTGLLVGDPHAPISRVAIALDPTLQAVRDAAEAGCNLLVTHHPVFLDPPSAIVADPRVSYSGSIVFEAVSSRVALANYHTALDVSAEARQVLPGMLGLSPYDILEPVTNVRSRGRMAGDDPLPKGYGHVCRVAQDDSLTLETLAARCVSVFGRTPRVWGDMGTQLSSVCTWTGSAGGAGRRCLAMGIDALVCGEIKYHEALEVRDLGLCVIELGHDVSELPLATALAQAVLDCGVRREDVCVLNQTGNWQTPESRRV